MIIESTPSAADDSYLRERFMDANPRADNALAQQLAAAYLARPPEAQQWAKGSPEIELYLWESHINQNAPDDWSGNVTQTARAIIEILNSAKATAPGTQMELALD